MTIENQLKKLILDHYESIRDFSFKIDMPCSTLNTILTRGIKSATLANILKICNALHISADALADGKIEYTYRPREKNSDDVGEILADTRRKLLSDNALMFNGKPANEESIQSILDAMEIGIEMAKRKADKK